MYTERVIDIEIYQFLKTYDLAERTAENYRHYLHGFYWHCIDNNIDPKEADILTVHEWFDENPGWANSTQVFAASAIRAFYKYKHGSNHPILKLRIKKIETPPQRTLNETDVLNILCSIDTTKPEGIRNTSIITMMIETGLRASEICNIELERLDLKNGKLLVPIKGRRWGEAVFFDYTKHCVQRWLGVRPFIAEPVCKYLYVSVGGKTQGKRLTRWGLRSTLKRLCNKAGVENVSPHVMRRTFATLLTEYGAPSRLVQVAGRWRDIRMVETYTKTLEAEKIKPYSVVNRLMGFDPSE